MTQPDWTVADRWLAGAATPDDERVLCAWADAVPAHRAWLDALRAESRTPDERWNADAAWARLSARTVGAPRSPRVLTVERGTAPWPRRTAWIGRVAAAALLVIGAGVVWRVGGSGAPGAVVAEATRELVAPRGGRADLRLDDGTRVVLNAGSRLRYAADFGGARGGRDVWLEGEGYFEVRHDAARPFRVHAANGVAEDLGTRFVVRAYPELPRVEVMVAEGRVALRDSAPARARADSAVLGAGQLGRLAADGTLSIDRPGTDRYLAWTTGTLVLDDLELRDALPVLERRYALAIRLADESLGTRRLVARFRDQPADEALDALALALGAHYERHGRDVTFHAGAR